MQDLERVSLLRYARRGLNAASRQLLSQIGPFHPTSREQRAQAGVGDFQQRFWIMRVAPRYYLHSGFFYESQLGRSRLKCEIQKRAQPADH